jgi:hypothetical protein
MSLSQLRNFAILLCVLLFSTQAYAEQDQEKDDDHRHDKLNFPYFTDFEKPPYQKDHDNHDREDNENPHEDWKTEGWWKISPAQGRRDSYSGIYHLDNDPNEITIGNRTAAITATVGENSNSRTDYKNGKQKGNNKKNKNGEHVEHEDDEDKPKEKPIAFKASLQDIVNDLNSVENGSKTIPWPPKKPGKWTCICRAKYFAFGWGVGPTMSDAYNSSFGVHIVPIAQEVVRFLRESP